MRAFVLLPLAVLLSACPPPRFSSLNRPEPAAPPPRYSFATPVSQGSCPALTDSTAVPFWVGCLPDDFNAHVASRRPERVDMETVDRRTLSGPSIVVQGDTARLGSLRVPMNRVDHLSIVQPEDNGQRLRAAGLVVGTTAGLGAGIGALSGNEAVGTGEATLRGLGAGGVVGLAFVAMAQGFESSERFEVVGWATPETAPQGRSVLVQEAGLQPSQWVGDQACGHPLPPGRRLDPPLRGRPDPEHPSRRVLGRGRRGPPPRWRAPPRARPRGHRRRGSCSTASASRSAAVSRIELSAPYGPFRVARPTAKGALTGAALRAAVRRRGRRRLRRRRRAVARRRAGRRAGRGERADAGLGPGPATASATSPTSRTRDPERGAGVAGPCATRPACRSPSPPPSCSAGTNARALLSGSRRRGSPSPSSSTRASRTATPPSSGWAGASASTGSPTTRATTTGA